MVIRKYGCIKDKPDDRDFKFRLAAPVDAPDLVDLRPNCPPVYNQHELGSCSANAIGGAIEFDQIKQGMVPWVPSRLFIYYNERAMEGTINEDAGAQIRDGIKCINTLGVCPETEWPYDMEKFAIKPLLECYTTAKEHPSVLYHSVNQDQHSIEQALASGFPVVFGFTVYEKFESEEVASTGILPMLDDEKQECMGGHAVLCVGYDRIKQLFLVRNSWGEEWGQAGYFWMPYEYMLNENLAHDFWVIQSVK